MLMASGFLAAAANAQDLATEKKTFELPSYTTVGGKPIKNVRIGWESYGQLNADKSNAILITHFFSGSSHAAGKYKPDDKAAGYWDAIIGPGKAVDTNTYYVISADTLVNLNAKDPTVVTTGPASINPDTGKPYGLSFPIVTIRDFVNVQKALLESLGIKKLHAVMGASMGALQVYEWASIYPEMVGKAVPVIGAGESDGYLIAWLDVWGAPIRLDPNWNNGDYYGGKEPLDGLAVALKTVTLHAQHWAWANGPNLGRKWAVADKDPASCLYDCKYAIEATLDAAAGGVPPLGRQPLPLSREGQPAVRRRRHQSRGRTEAHRRAGAAHHLRRRSGLPRRRRQPDSASDQGGRNAAAARQDQRLAAATSTAWWRSVRPAPQSRRSWRRNDLVIPALCPGSSSQSAAVGMGMDPGHEHWDYKGASSAGP
jgi:homoserine O-acetyltransferase